MRVIHDICGSLMVNVEMLVCMLKSDIWYWPLSSKTNVKNNKCNINFQIHQHRALVSKYVNVEELIKDSAVKQWLTANSDLMYLCK